MANEEESGKIGLEQQRNPCEFVERGIIKGYEEG